MAFLSGFLVRLHPSYHIHVRLHERSVLCEETCCDSVADVETSNGGALERRCVFVTNGDGACVCVS